MNILIIGLGSIAQKHIKAIRSVIPDAHIYALRSSVNPTNSLPDVTDIYSLEECLVKFDFAIISNPTSKHGATIDSLLELNIPLFIEKPVFESLNYDHLIEKIAIKGIPTYVACNMRFLESLGFLHDYIRDHPEKKINEVNVYCGSYLPEWRPKANYRLSYSAIPELGGGVNIDLIHDIDYTCWIFGRPIKSYGICRNVSTLNIRAFDYACFSLIYPNFTASVILNYYRRDYRRTLEIVFEDDSWSANLALNIITDSNGKTVFRGRNVITDTYTSQLKYFIDSITNKSIIENNIFNAYETLKICLNYERP